MPLDLMPRSCVSGRMTSNTSIVLTKQDRAILEKLKRATGLASAAAVIRLAIRESLAARAKAAA